MQDLDPKCRHFGILWQFMAFCIFAKKSDRKSDPIFPILSDFFWFLDFSRLSDSTALILTEWFYTFAQNDTQKKGEFDD